MIDIIHVEDNITIGDYEKVVFLSRAVDEMLQKVNPLLPDLHNRTIWMVNSTARGGGVAEMLPRMISLMRGLGLDVRWAVIQTDNQVFFRLTKNIHNLIHGAGELTLDEEKRSVFEAVNRENADSLKQHIKPGDILIVHDPQPMPLGRMLKAELDIHTIWRCHIGLGESTERTRHAWDFLRKYADGYDHAVFTAPAYVPDYLKHNYRIIHPAIDPFNHKNRDLDPVKLMGILCNASLAKPHQPIVTPPFQYPAQRMQKDGSFGPATEPDEIGLFFRPIVTEISRWDRLKGFLPLMKGFAEMKQQALGRSGEEWKRKRHRRRMDIVRLVLAGPDPSSIQDDPEGLEVMAELTDTYTALPDDLQKDIVILALPMQSRKENALMVNVLQRVSLVVVQNSLQEGFGLTVTEAMWKRKPIFASHATGIRQQIDHGEDGCINPRPEDECEIARQLEMLIQSDQDRDRLGANAQRKVYEKFLVFTQIANWIETMQDVVRNGSSPRNTSP